MCRFLLSAIAALTVGVTTARAQLLDQMLSEQVATTNAGKTTDTTQIKAPAEEKVWSSRVFRAQSREVCGAGKPSSVSLATTEPGRVQVALTNARGEVSITWRFGDEVPASELRFSGIELSLLNQDPRSDLTVSMSTALNTSAIRLSSTRTQIQVPKIPSPQGKRISVSFLDLAPTVFKSRSILVNSLTVSLSVDSGCDALYAIQSVTLIPREVSSAKKSKSISRAAIEEETPTVESTETPQQDPCTTDETVPQKIAECEADARRRGSSCAEWTCHCVPDTKTQTYFISRASISFGSSVGKECVNHTCGDQPGRCSDWGTCMPPQFYGYEHPLISISDTVGFSASGNSIDLECVDNTRIPSSQQLCSLTPTQVEQMVASSITVGSPCELTQGRQGICDPSGRCVPDTKADYYCKNNVNCTPCGAPGNLCWNGKCLTLEQASFQLCQRTHYFTSGRGICKQCYATFALHKDGSCGTGVISSDPRGVNMNGASCWRDNGRLKGTCLDGQCLAQPTPAASPSPQASPGSSSR